MSKISIIIPVYNSEKYIKNCINSVLNQSCRDIEVIAVDDGSADNSLAILNEIARADERLIVLSKPNGGVSSARNMGIENAGGEFISFVDSDDTLTPDAMQTLYSRVNDDIDLISGSYILKGITTKYITHSDTVFTADEKYSRFYEYDKTNWGPCAKLYRRSIIDKYNIRFTEGVSYGEDHIFNLNYTKHITGNMVVLSDCIYVYNNQLRQNLCSRAYYDIADSHKLLFETIYHYFDGSDVDEAVRLTQLFPIINGTLEHYLALFDKKTAVERIEYTFSVFDEYITDEILSESLSPAQIENIKSKRFDEFARVYEAENPVVKKRRIKNIIKRILTKLL